jgi:hypothetical protein
MAVNYQQYAAEMITQMDLVNASISTAGSLDNASPTVLAVVYDAVQNALVPFQSAITAFDADIDTTSVGSVVAGDAAPQLTAALLNQAFDVAQQAVLVVAEAYVTRVGVNIQDSPG